jgi:hypothetical protein
MVLSEGYISILVLSLGYFDIGFLDTDVLVKKAQAFPVSAYGFQANSLNLHGKTVKHLN